MKMVVAKLPCPLETTEVAIAELLAQYEEMAIAELHIDQKEWQVHGPQVTISVFDLTVYAASTVISVSIKSCYKYTVSCA
jgi:hypothetical protein